MPTPIPPPSPFMWFFTSRKGLLTLFTLIVALLFAVVVVVQVFRGRMTPEAGLAFAGGGLLGWFGIAFKTIDAISKEDVATKSNVPSTVVAGGDVTMKTETKQASASPATTDVTTTTTAS